MNAEKLRVGFVGVGLMGRGMAKNILGGGWPLAVVAHKNRAPIDALVARGAKEADSVAALAAQTDVVFLCLPSSTEVKKIVLGGGGLLENGREGMIVVDTGTSHPASTRAIDRRLRAAGIRFAAAPLARSPAMAEQGKLASLVSAEDGVFESLRPVLESYSEIVIRAGEEIGRAHEIKLINNFVAVGCAAIWAEAYSACASAGCDAETFHAFVSGGGLNCLNFQNFSKFALAGDADGHKFTIANCAKDIDYFVRFADAMGHSTLAADGARQLFKLAVANGHGARFAPALTRFVRELNGGA